MEEGVGEECGVGGVYLKGANESSKRVPSLLIAMGSMLQHRGQRSAGIASYKSFQEGLEKRLAVYKELGLVSEVFRTSNPPEHEKILNFSKGVAGIVHTRYSTSGIRDDYFALRDEVQPFLRHHGRPGKRFALGFNGNLANYSDLAEDIVRVGYALDTHTDTEVLMHLFALHLNHLSKKDANNITILPSLFDVAQGVMEHLDGSYNITFLSGDGKLLVIRDPRGFHPLVWGENQEFYAVASESVALEKIGIDNYQDVTPGTALMFSDKGLEQTSIIRPTPRFCQFEWVYFQKAASRNEGLSVKKVREGLGRELALREPLRDKLNRDYVVVPAPRTAISAAEAYGEILGLQVRSAIEKNESLRAFINAREERERIMQGVYTILRDDIHGKNIILLDDSIVRGETSKQLIGQLRAHGAKEVHLRSTEPPIRFPCFYGIDFPTSKELAANQFNFERLEEEMASWLGADSVVFQTLEGLEKAIGCDRTKLCTACLTGDYPTPCGGKRLKRLNNLIDRIKV